MNSQTKCCEEKGVDVVAFIFTSGRKTKYKNNLSNQIKISYSDKGKRIICKREQSNEVYSTRYEQEKNLENAV